MEFYPGFEIKVEKQPMNFVYGEGVCGPSPEIRHLSDIRASLAEPDCKGPEDLYCIAMDVYKEEDRQDLLDRNLLYGIVTYAAGQLGSEPIRSQGHIHAISPSCNASTCEVYEIWDGEAIIYMQESGSDDAGNCYAVHAKAGEVVIVPPNWVHATINADVTKPMTFGAWCVRDYGFDYKEVRAHHGIAYFPKVVEGKMVWEPNAMYKSAKLIEKPARQYPEFNIQNGISIYEQYQKDRAKFDFVVNPKSAQALWDTYKA